jgi:hypothetical protein
MNVRPPLRLRIVTHTHTHTHTHVQLNPEFNNTTVFSITAISSLYSSEKNLLAVSRLIFLTHQAAVLSNVQYHDAKLADVLLASRHDRYQAKNNPMSCRGSKNADHALESTRSQDGLSYHLVKENLITITCFFSQTEQNNYDQTCLSNVFGLAPFIALHIVN